ncbi:hypothetical protein F8M41_000206 [Gigaspora margarita]|uniref:Uncharacterized protein n=1 Tax=Gigaspora margarita TaxID=4874 RepID=A0A8H3XI30_GIGMA|nr:hypothetical protein F8M41_000206 [Gigaspora margarita]
MEELVYLGVDLPGIKAPTIIPEDRRPVRTLENRLEKLRRKKVSVTEVLDSYYVPETIRGNDSEVVLSENPKQVGNKLDLDVALEDLIDGYLEELQNLVPKLVGLDKDIGMSRDGKDDGIGMDEIETAFECLPSKKESSEFNQPNHEEDYDRNDYQESAKEEGVDGIYSLGHHYHEILVEKGENEEISVKKDDHKAIAYYQKLVKMDYADKEVDKYTNRIGVEIDKYYPDKDEEDNMNDNAELNKASDDDNETMVDEKNYEIDKARTKKNKEGICHFEWSLKSAEDDSSVRYDPRIGCRNDVGIGKGIKATKDSVDGTPDEEDNLKLVEMEKAMATELSGVIFKEKVLTNALCKNSTPISLELDLKEMDQKEEKKTENIPTSPVEDALGNEALDETDCKTLVEEEDNEVEGLAEKKDLDHACECWIKKVEEFRRAKEESHVDDCCRK